MIQIRERLKTDWVCNDDTGWHGEAPLVNNNNNYNHILYSPQREIKAVVRSHNEEHSSIIRSHETLLVQELCESRGGRTGLSVLTSLLVSVDVKNY